MPDNKVRPSLSEKADPIVLTKIEAQPIGPCVEDERAEVKRII